MTAKGDESGPFHSGTRRRIIFNLFFLLLSVALMAGCFATPLPKLRRRRNGASLSAPGKLKKNTSREFFLKNNRFSKSRRNQLISGLVILYFVNHHSIHHLSNTNQLVGLTIPSLGEIQGSYLQSSSGRIFMSFRAIPYAEPPVGPLRFKVMLIHFKV